MLANTPHPPYYAVIFTSCRTEEDFGYEITANRMLALAKEQPGFLGVESARAEIGITISYWQSLEAIQNWKNHAEHVMAQHQGRQQWYQSYKTRICLVERDYSFEKERSSENEGNKFNNSSERGMV